MWNDCLNWVLIYLLVFPILFYVIDKLLYFYVKHVIEFSCYSQIVQQELFKQTKKLKKETESEKEMYKKMFGSSKAPVEDKKEPDNAVSSSLWS